MKYILFLTLIVFTIGKASAQMEMVDSTKSSYFLALPYGNYSEETDWVGGAVASYYFWTKNAINRVSNLSAIATYSLNKQAIVGLYHRLYLKDKYYLYGRWKYEKYPDYFWGVGNLNPDDSKELYIPNRLHINFEPQLFLNDKNLVGVALEVRSEEITEYAEDGMLRTKTISGSKPYAVFGIGGIYFRDTRDNNYYPYKGSYFKNVIKFFGGSYQYMNIRSDYRIYKSIKKEHVIANQTVVNFTVGQVPFQLLPTLGGTDELRGYRRGQFIDHVYLLNQTEYRFPLYKKFSGTVFVSAGNVWNSAEGIRFKDLKIAAGVGLRYRLNDARINLRGDGAINRNGSTGTYLTSTEAF